MENARIDIAQDFDGELVVFACFDASEEQVGALAHAVAATADERYRLPEVSSDDVLTLRELTAIADELREIRGGIGTVVLRPARLSAMRDAVAGFVESRDSAEWLREEDREPLAVVRSLLFPLEQLCGEAMRAALSPVPRPG
jgi:hypothetical protein